MSKLLFLEGESGIGKSTMILEAAHPYRTQGMGLFSLRLEDTGGNTKAFQLVPYQQVEKSVGIFQAGMPHIFLENPWGEPIIHREVFEEAAVILGDYEQASFLLLDEIGGMDLDSPSFMKLLDEILESEIPCIGVLKSRKNLAHMKEHMGEMKEKMTSYEKFRKRLQERYHATILTVEKRNQNLVKNEIAVFFQENGKVRTSL